MMKNFEYLFTLILFALAISIIGALIVKIACFLMFYVCTGLSIIWGLTLLVLFMINAIRLVNDII